MDTRDVSRPPGAPDLAVLELGGGVGEGAARGLVFLSAAVEARAPAAAVAEAPDPDPAVRRLSFPLNSGPDSLSPLSLTHSLSLSLYLASPFFPQVGRRRGGCGRRCGDVGKAAEARRRAGGGMTAAGRTAAGAWAAGLRWGPQRPPVG